jgi:hypothetical protein
MQCRTDSARMHKKDECRMNQRVVFATVPTELYQLVGSAWYPHRRATSSNCTDPLELSLSPPSPASPPSPIFPTTPPFVRILCRLRGDESIFDQYMCLVGTAARTFTFIAVFFYKRLYVILARVSRGRRGVCGPCTHCGWAPGRAVRRALPWRRRIANEIRWRCPRRNTCCQHD